jgi:hypothetical protein
MARKKIDDQVVAQWIQLHRKGVSYRSIGRDFDVDSRTVKSWIERAGEEKEKEHWEAVSRQVDAKYLDEHYRMLLQIAVALLSAVHSDPISEGYETDDRSILSGKIVYALQKCAGLFLERGLSEANDQYKHLESNDVDRLGHRLFNALMEHEPLLKAAFDAWKIEWNGFQKAKTDLIKSAKELFENLRLDHKSPIDVSIKADVCRKIVLEALLQNVLGKEPLSSKVDAFDDNVFRFSRYNEHLEIIVYYGPKTVEEVIHTAYDRLLPQITHKERLALIKTNYASLTGQAKKVEEFIDHLILTGRPSGNCVLCSHQPIRLP